MTCCRQTSVPDIELVGDDVTLVIEGAGEVGQDPGIETRRRPGNLEVPRQRDTLLQVAADHPTQAVGRRDRPMPWMEQHYDGMSRINPTVSRIRARATGPTLPLT